MPPQARSHVAISVTTLIDRLSLIVDQQLARDAIEAYVEMRQRFLGGDWAPAELNGGRVCEAISRCLLQLDTGTVNPTELPGKIRESLLNKSLAHSLQQKDREHIAKVIDLVYKFRSDRGAVHISPIHSANGMDAMLVLHAGKWIFAEFLRLAWNSDRKIVGQVIEQLVQLEHSLIHELDGRPLVVARDISAPEEVLLLLSHASNNRLTRTEIRNLAPNQNPRTIAAAITKLVSSREIRDAGNGEVALTPPGQQRILNVILPKYTKFE